MPYHRAILPIFGTALDVAESCAVATFSNGMAVRARDEVAKSLCRRSGAMRNDISADDDECWKSISVQSLGRGG
jgi:hypothetical protein